MASLFKQHKSQFWWIKWRNPIANKVVRFSTKFKIGDPAQHRKAIHLKNEYALKESAAASFDHPFRDWVQEYFEAQHAASANTLARYTSMWKTIATYLDSIKISAPSQVHREHCLGYIKWRKKLPHLNGKKPVCHNTAITELKVLSKVMYEAFRREWIPGNPCAKLGLKREKHREKHEMSDEQIQIILRTIARLQAKAKTPEQKRRADFYFLSFEIARFQGVRLSETRVALADVDLVNQEITLNAKGGRRYTTLLNPSLVPLFQKLKNEGREFSYPAPAFRTQHALWWFKFFDRLRKKDPGFNHISHHSGRVTVISRMERAGAAEKAVMQLVNHASTTVHRVYRKTKKSELLPYWNAASSAPVIQPASVSVSSDTPA